MNEFDSNGMNPNPTNSMEPVMIPDNEVEVNQELGMEDVAPTVNPTPINPEPVASVAPASSIAQPQPEPAPAPVQMENTYQPEVVPVMAPVEALKEDMMQPQSQNAYFDENTEQPRRKRHVFRTIFNIVFTLVVLTILANAILAVVNFNQLVNEKAPYLFTTSEVKTEDGNTYHTYPQALFKIVHTTTEMNETWSLKPFFMN